MVLDELIEVLLEFDLCTGLYANTCSIAGSQIAVTQIGAHCYLVHLVLNRCEKYEGAEGSPSCHHSILDVTFF